MKPTTSTAGEAPPENSLPPTPHTVQLRKTARPDSDRYYIYLPTHWLPERTIVAVHGISRGAREQANELARLADQHQAIVIAPLFDEYRFPDYQRLGRQGLGERADRALQRVITDVETTLGAALTPFSIFGFSGGGQFAHRYALANPNHIRRAVITAAGWFTLPDETEAFPKGIGACDRLADLRFDLAGLLEIPILVVASLLDTTRDATLRRHKQLDKTQGRNRLERGRRWVRAMRRTARDRGLDPRCRFRALAHSDHDFVAAVRNDHLDELIFDYFFGTASKSQP